MGLIFLLKKHLTEDLDKMDSPEEKQKTSIGFFTMLKHKRILFAALCQFFNILCFTMGQPILSPRFIEDYEFSNAIVGLLFAFPTLFYIITGPILLPIVTKGFECRGTMMTGFFLLAMSGYFIGPSKILGLPDQSSVLMIIGMALLGTGAAFTVIPVIPEMLDSVKGKYPEHQNELNDCFSSIFNVAGGFGQIVGPMFAGFTNDRVGFNYTFDIFASTILTFNILYILF